MNTNNKERSEKMESFLADIKTILKKHDGFIGFEVGISSDTYGLYDEQMYLYLNDPDEKFTVDGWSFDSSDL